MRTVALVVVLVAGLTLAPSRADAQHYRSNNVVYVYPQGTVGYYSGPYGRSENYIMPTATLGFQNWSNVPVYQTYQVAPVYQSYQVAPVYGNIHYGNRSYQHWNGYPYYYGR